LLLAGCSPDPSQESASQTPFARDLAPRLATCTGCHGGSTPQGGLDLTDVRATFDVASKQVDMALVEPGNHLRSYLWHKVAGTQSIAGGLGQRMPVGDAWSDEDVDLLARWIDLGAPP
jgi:hypothetical protein